MVVGDFDVAWAKGAVRPLEANAVLVVDPDAELAFTVSNERFEAIAGKTAECLEIGRRFQPVQTNFRLAPKGLIQWSSARSRVRLFR